MPPSGRSTSLILLRTRKKSWTKVPSLMLLKSGMLRYSLFLTLETRIRKYHLCSTCRMAPEGGIALTGNKAFTSPNDYSRKGRFTHTLNDPSRAQMAKWEAYRLASCISIVKQFVLPEAFTPRSTRQLPDLMDNAGPRNVLRLILVATFSFNESLGIREDGRHPLDQVERIRGGFLSHNFTSEVLLGSSPMKEHHCQ